MSETARKLFEGLKTARDAVQDALPGLRSFGQDVKAELGRHATQGASELAAALFNGHGYVMYGAGQRMPSVDQEHEHSREPELELGPDGRRRNASAETPHASAGHWR